MIIEYIRSFVGIPPVGLEYLEYVGAVCFFLLLFKVLINMFASLAKFMGAK